MDIIGKDQIELHVYDFDGVMTDNKVWVDQNGIETVQVNRADGWAVGQFKTKGLMQVILSTETNPVVSARAKKLGIRCMQGSSSKLADLTAFCKKETIALDAVLYIGNDLNDLEVMTKVGYRVCPSDAHDKIKKVSNFVTSSAGGQGVIRELFDMIFPE
ncbi:MAG: 3-deoxy-D-manno-octulosonate 8-phosphate phosphatase (KDO 8-P phosphatase) [Candidatus Marinamargulisbacteria bacterium]|jgi:3-deoxy-D-manno-octulosonate 8-phosphate phosphatase (KDO 8-P phosphatase)